ncbi:bacteriohemerythrin [Treponema pectinovorum]|uniref:bacteriohemerythrin n=1 Tax=Treponema pectinovorum TaxID=164 RepID=UPI0011C9AFB7|nr:hemerythrin family protein [Treponema pectinovorum]
MDTKIERIEWNDSYLLGVDEIDKQHKQLLAIANELYDVVTGSEDEYEEKMKVVLKKLSDYTVYHFTSEEELQQKIGYNGLDSHKLAHDFFIKEIGFQLKKLSTENKANVLSFYKYIANWVLTHIAKADKLWAIYMQNSGKTV